MSDKVDRLLSQLRTSGLQNKDNPLFQVINQIIKYLKDIQTLLENQISPGGTTSGVNTGDVTLAGTPTYITISGQVITRNLIGINDLDFQIRDVGYWTPLVNVIGAGDVEMVVSDAGQPIAVWTPT